MPKWVKIQMLCFCIYYCGFIQDYVWRQLELCVFRAWLRLRTFLFLGGIKK